MDHYCINCEYEKTCEIAHYVWWCEEYRKKPGVWVSVLEKSEE